MTRKQRYRPAALVDLDNAEAYTRRTWGNRQAKAYIAALIADMKDLRGAPFRNPAFEGILPGLRRKRSGMHHIYYIVADESVEVLAVIHVQRDPGSRLEGEVGSGDEGDG